MLPWLAALAGTLYTFVATFRWVRRSEGRDATRRRLPLLGATTFLAGAGLVVVASFFPGQWWNYLLVPGSAFEWYAVAAWYERRKEAGGVRFPFRRTPMRGSLLLLAGVAILGGVMEIREDGTALSNLFLVALGASNLAVFLAVERARPGMVEAGVLLFDRLIPWKEVDTWELNNGRTLQLGLTGPRPGRMRLEVEPSAAPSVVGLLRRGRPEGEGDGRPLGESPPVRDAL